MTRLLTRDPGARCAVAFCLGLAAAIGASSSACSRKESGSETLPGHSRPIVAHDWAHPREFTFAASTFSAPDPTAALITTGTGTRAYVLADKADRVVRITAAFPSGRLRERSDEAGASDLLIDILTRRGPVGSQTSLSRRLETMGLPVDWFQGSSNPMMRPFSGEEAAGAAPPEVRQLPDVAGLSIEVLPDDWDDALALMVDIVRRPDLDPALIGGYRAGSGYSAMAGLASNGFRPAVELERLIHGHPISPPEAGSTLSTDAVSRFAARTLGADSVIFGIGGNIDREAVKASFEKLTAGWPRATEPPHLEAVKDTTGAGRLQLIDTPAIQAWFAIGRTVASVPESEQAAFAVAGDILDTRLNIVTREVRGLTNRDTLILPDSANGAGLVQVRSGGRAESIAPLIKLTLAELARLREPTSEIEAEELARAKGALVLGRWQSAFAGAAVGSATLAFEHAQHGVPPNPGEWPRAVEAVSAEQVRASAGKYFDPDSMTIVVVGPVGEIREARHPRWPESLDGIRPESRSSR